MAITVANRRDVPTLRVAGDAEAGLAGGGPTYVYVGRPSPLGNPFRIGRDGGRDQVIALFAHWFDLQRSVFADGVVARELARLTDLARAGDLVLVCHCAPLDCHARIIKEVIEAVLAGEGD